MRRPTQATHEERSPAVNVKRRVVIGAAMVTFALLVFIAVPAHLAWQPGFIERYPGLEFAYDTWAESLHSTVACQECHVPPGIRSQVGYGTRMLGEYYLSIVLSSHEPDRFERPVNEACLKCHMDLRTISPSGDLNIPHRAHIEALGMDCVECHGFVVHEMNAEGRHTPLMADCLTCHDGETAKNECAACHTDKDPPETHFEVEWVFSHARVVDEGCNTCHDWAEDWCADCHAARPASHGDDWRAQHRYRVESNRNCEACHEGPFCFRCHGEVPELNFDPSLEIVR